jgi:hypothetical protein
MMDWNIQSRAHACQACGRAFADKQGYHTVLFDERGGYLRQDVCEPCWTAQHSQGISDRKGFISQWRGVFEIPPAVPDPIQKETAESLLRKLLEQGNAADGPACFILAVMLERKRVLKVKEQVEREGRRVLLYEHAKTGELFTLIDPGLKLDQLGQVQHDVSRLLEHGLTPPPPAAAAAAAPAATPDAQAENSTPQAAATESPAASGS